MNSEEGVLNLYHDLVSGSSGKSGIQQWTNLEDDQLIIEVELMMSQRVGLRDEVGRLRLILSDSTKGQHGGQ